MATRSPLLLQATPVEAVSGEGCWLLDAQGRRYLDFTAGIGVTSTGHCHPAVVEAIQRQAAELIHGQVTTVMHPRLDEMTDALCDALPGFGSVFVANSGSEAVEAAVRLARHATGRPNIVAFQGGFHGRTMGAASLTTSKLAVRAGLQPLMGGVVLAPFPYAHRYGWSEDEAVAFCLRELDHLFATTTAPWETAAILLEPVLGEGGYIPAPDAFVQGLRDAAIATGCCSSPTRSRPVWVAPGECGAWSTRACGLMSSWWPRVSPAACRCRRSWPPPSSWPRALPAPRVAPTAATRWRVRRRWPPSE